MIFKTDYEHRKQVGKTIGSGWVEKRVVVLNSSMNWNEVSVHTTLNSYSKQQSQGVDQVIEHCQKRKGTSWRSKDSKALAILSILELNGQWQQVWFPAQAI